ncbi:excisionase family DNA-binding protein [Streptosporangium amethystogenes subsp. fukuiense]|uniref:Excisionase family DNA-binding protein n=1 Tax=Streptosporangium amethystogenes subsp. fukuiense TaxID=698418 RepID=A0ABW2T6U5_9ACTN
MTVAPIQPNSSDALAARDALRRVRGYLRRHPDSPARIPVVAEETREELVMPRVAVELLATILAHMAAGRGVSVVPAHAELTTQEAADLLNVSRPYLIGLLEAGEIEYRLVGTHRRVKLESLLDYRRKDDQRRREAADELSAATRELGFD